MAKPLPSAFLTSLLDNLVGSDWPIQHLNLVLSGGSNGVVTGAEDHVAALKALARLDMGYLPLPSRLCLPDEFDA